jgi:hypothetical protein
MSTGDSENPPQAEQELEPEASRETRSADDTKGAGTVGEPPSVMIPARHTRPPLEAALMRVVATCGIIGIGVAIAAIMTSQHSKGWLIGLVVSIVSVVLAAVLWSSRRL